MLARGVSPVSVLGPEHLCPRDLLDPTADPTSHSISQVMAEVLTTFPHVKLPEKLAFMYLMHLTTRVSQADTLPQSHPQLIPGIQWQVSPNMDSYSRLPVWLRPTVMQITVPHAAWIDNIPWWASVRCSRFYQYN